MRTFETGATRDDDADKLDFDGFLDPVVIFRYANYLHKHRRQADGKMRESDNWKKGMSVDVYMKSMWRHFMDVWYFHYHPSGQDAIEEALCALMFNVMGYLYEEIK